MPVYPTGNIHLSYYEDVIDFFESEGADFQDSKIVTVGADLIGWYLKERFPDAEVETVEVNSSTSYLQNFAGNYLSNEEPRKSYEKLKSLLGLNTNLDRSTVLSEHQNFVESENSPFDDEKDVLEMEFQPGEYYAEILNEIGFNTRQPDETHVEDIRDVSICHADIAFTNNIYDKVGPAEFQESISGLVDNEGFLEMNTLTPSYNKNLEPEPVRKLEFSDSSVFYDPEVNPDVRFWWNFLPEEEKNTTDYSETVLLFTP